MVVALFLLYHVAYVVVALVLLYHLAYLVVALVLLYHLAYLVVVVLGMYICPMAAVWWVSVCLEMMLRVFYLAR